MGNTLNVVECCGPCSLDQKKDINTIKSKRDMEPRSNMVGFEDSGMKAKLDNIVTVTEEDRSLDISVDTGGNPSATAPFSWRNMTRQDYFNLYDAIHRLVRQDKISKEEESEMYNMIGKQDKAFVAAYKKYKEDLDPLVLIKPCQDSRAKSQK